MRALLLTLTLILPLAAQDPPVSPLTGISLPASARLDKGFMNRMAGRMTLDDALKSRQATLGNYEMYKLPPGSDANWTAFSAQLARQGWTLTELPDPDFKLAWAAKGATRYFVLFMAKPKETWVYLAEAAGVAPAPVASAPANPAPPRQPAPAPAPAGAPDRKFVGVWIRSISFDMRSAVGAGYTKHQYIFEANGTYAYSRRHFPGTGYRLWVWRETGRWAVDRDLLTLAPERSVLDELEKKGGVDANGPLVSRKAQPLERATYRVRTHYFSGLQEWNLVLEASAPTQRDGSFTTNPNFPGAWLFSPASANNTVIDSGFTGW